MVVSLFCTCGAGVAVAAEPAPQGHYLHDGFYLRYSLGPGVGHIGGTSPGGSFGDTGAGAGDIFAIGGTLPGGVVLGGASMALYSKGSLGAVLGPFVDWFPDPRGGWHLGADLGLGVTQFLETPPGSAAATLSPDTWLHGYGLGAALFAGHDFWIAPQASIGLLALVSMMPSTAAQDAPGYALTPLWAGVLLGILYH
jgi:hypothetical protein